MVDCPNAEIRDRLPELIHDRLEPGERAEVLAHVAQCAACASELALLRELRSALSEVPAVDLSRIVHALPRPMGRSRRRRIDWRVAAAIAVVVVGGTSTWTLRYRGGEPGARSTSTASGDRAPTTTGAGLPDRSMVNSPQAIGPTSDRSTELSVAGLGDLSERELQSLLSDIGGFDALPSAEPDVMTPPIHASENRP